LGGVTALLGVEQETRLRAGIIIDGDVPDSLIRETNAPVLILAMGRQWNVNECRLWDKLQGSVAVSLRGTEHLTPTDAVWLAPGAVKTGTMGPVKTISAIRDYIALFLDRNLRATAMDGISRGAFPEYPGATVTQQQSLCKGGR
jgi:hypothetical protein